MEQFLPDGGPLYAETDLTRIIVEPWNSISSLSFLLPAFYCLILIKGKFSAHRLLTVSIILLILGGLGSTLYHAFRSSKYLLALDVFPIQILSFIIIIFFWSRIFTKIHHTAFLIMTFMVVKLILVKYHMFPNSTNVSYFLNGVMIFLPLVLYLRKTGFKNATIIISSMFFFIISLLCRQLDLYSRDLMPMGTHWLWHLFSAAGAALLGLYLFRINNPQLK